MNGAVTGMIRAAKAAHTLIREQFDNLDDEEADQVLEELQEAINRLEDETDKLRAYSRRREL